MTPTVNAFQPAENEINSPPVSQPPFYSAKAAAVNFGGSGP
jgi:hypothetical protein